MTRYERYLHGEAISLGMHAAGALSCNMGLVDDTFVERQRACLEDYGLPVTWPDIPAETVMEAMRRDKKVRAGTMKFILADRIGHVVQRTDVSEEQTLTALGALRDASKGTPA